LKIIKALPDEFYPVEPGGDLFAPEPEPEETGDDQDKF
jgi:hypothetical protein